MRIYKKYVFDVAKICAFKETYEFIEKLIGRLDVNYNKLLFKFEDMKASNKTMGTEKIAKKFPNLEVQKVKNEHSESIIITNYNTPYNKSFENDIKTISVGIPRTFNVGYESRIAFSDINWFGCDRELNDCVLQGNTAIGGTTGNYIEMVKGWGFGNKYNPIFVSIEVTHPSNPDGILDVSSYLQAMTKIMGNPFKEEMVLCLDDMEQKEADEKQRLITNIVKQTQLEVDKQLFMPYPWKAVANSMSDSYYMNNYKLSVKKGLSMLAKKNGFKFLSCKQKVYYYEKKDEYNNRILIELICGLSSPMINCTVRYENFIHLYKGIVLPLYAPKNQEDIEQFSENVFATIAFLERTMISQLVPIYGKTPKWYEFRKDE